MNDLATLGIAVDSSPAAKATTDLDKLTNAAVRAEDAVNDLGDSSSTSLKEVGKSAAPLPSALKEIETSAKSAGKAADGMVSPQLINQMNQFEASLRSGAKSTAELEVQRSQLRSLQKSGMVDDAEAIKINQRLDKTQQDLTKSAVQQEKAIDQLMRSIDPTSAKLAKLDRDTEELGRALDKGAIDAKTYATAIGKIDESIARLNGANDPINETTSAMGRLGLGSRQAREDVLQLGNAVAAGDWQGAARNIAQLGAEAGTAGSGLLAAVAPAVGLAAVIGFLGVAYYDTIQEAREFNAAINSNGNSAGQTILSLGQLSARAGELTGNYSGAKEAILALASSTQVSAVQLENLGEAAAAIGTITGKSAAEVATALAGIGSNATDAAGKVSDQYGLITSAQYDVIKALDDNGEHQKALDVLSENLNTAAQERLKKYRESLSEIERDWIDIKNATIRAYAEVRGELFPNDAKQLELIRRQIDYINAHPILSGLTSPFSNGLKSRDEVLAEYQAQAAALEKKIALSKQDAEQTTETQTAERELISVKKELNAQLDDSSPATKRSKAIDDLNDRYFKLWSTTAKLNKEDEALLKGVSYDGKNFSGGAYDTLLKAANDKNKDAKISAGSVDLSAFNDAENQLKAIVAQYDNSQKELDALQQAGRITQEQYSTQRTTLIRAEKDEVTAAYEAEISALEAAKNKATTTGAQRIQIDQKIADARAAMVKAEQAADSKLTVLAINEEERIKKRDALVDSYIASLNDEIAKVKEQQAAQLAGAGMGDQARQRLQDDIKIQQSYQDKLDKLRDQHNKKQIDDDVYARETAAVKAALTERLAEQQRYYAETDKQQQDWVLGAKSAFNTYLEQAQNTFGLVKSAFSSSLSSLEDYLVSFISKGKASFRDFADSVIAEFARIVVKQQVIAPLISTFFGDSAKSGSGSSTGALGGGTGSSFTDLLSYGKTAIQLASTGVGSAAIEGFKAGSGLVGSLTGGGTAAYNSLVGAITGNTAAIGASQAGYTSSAFANWAASGGSSAGAAGAGAAGGASGAAGAGLSAGGAALYGIGGALYGYQQAGLKGAATGAAGAVGGAYAGAAIGSVVPIIGTAIGAAIGAALGGMLGGSVFGGDWVTKNSGLQLAVNDNNLDAYNFEYQKKKGGLFSSNKKRTKLSALDDETQDALDTAYEKTQTSVEDLFKTLNVNVKNGLLDGLDVGVLQISTKDNTPEQVQEKITAWFGTVADAMVGAINTGATAGLDGYNFETLTTFVNNLTSVDQVLKNLNVGVFDFSVSGGKMAEQLSALAGGLDALTTSASTYYDKFFTDAEKADDVLDAVNKQFSAVNIALPATREGFRAAVEGLDLTTEAGRTLFATLIGLSGNAAQAYDILEQRAASAQAANANYYDLFTTDAEKSADKLLGVRAEFKALGVELPATSQAFMEMVYAAQQGKVAGKATADALLGLATDASAAYKILQGAATQGANDAFSALQRSINAQKTSINDLLTTANTNVSDLTGVSNDLSTALKALRGDSADAVTMLRNQAQATLQSALATARSGGSLAGFAGLSDALSTVSSNNTDLYSSLDDFNRDQGRTANVIDELNKLNGKQLTSAEQTVKALQDQLKALDDQLALAQSELDMLNGIDGSIKSVADAVKAMNAAVVAALLSLPKGAAQANTPQNNNNAINLIYDQLLGRDADAGGLAFWSAALQNGSMSYDQVYAAIKQSAADNGQLKVPGYATGGMFGGGLRLVGEKGPELEVTGPSRIYNANQTAAMLGGGGGDSASASEIRELRREMESNATYMARLTKTVADGIDTLVNSGMQVIGTVETKAVAA